MKHKVKIREVITFEVEVEAPTLKEAINKVRDGEFEGEKEVERVTDDVWEVM